MWDPSFNQRQLFSNLERNILRPPARVHQGARTPTFVYQIILERAHSAPTCIISRTNTYTWSPLALASRLFLSANNPSFLYRASTDTPDTFCGDILSDALYICKENFGIIVSNFWSDILPVKNFWIYHEYTYV